MEYTMNELVKLNSTPLWKHHIILPSVCYSPTTLFKLHATGRCDLNGRYYVAIRANRIVNYDMKRTYNLF